MISAPRFTISNPSFNFINVLRLLLIRTALACFRFLDLEAPQVFAKGRSNYHRTVHPSMPGSVIESVKKFRIQHDLNGFHTVKFTPQ
jgi:hypothetical protein